MRDRGLVADTHAWSTVLHACDEQDAPVGVRTKVEEFVSICLFIVIDFEVFLCLLLFYCFECFWSFFVISGSLTLLHHKKPIHQIPNNNNNNNT